jgi:AraC-like DNA-binding protein
VVYGRIPIENIVVHFTSESLGVELLAKPELKAVREMLHAASLGLEFSPAALAAVRRPLEKLPGLDGAARLLAFLQILDRLAAFGWSRQLASGNYNRPMLERNHLAFSKVLEYVQAHYREPISLDAVAAHAGMSRTTFTRFFHQIRKISFTVWLNEWRIQRAAGWLRETNLPVFDIAIRSGYRNLSHFNRQFGRIMKTTPTLWRQRQ